jgi:tetratricopeptide (TPR) repeat protein
MPIAAWAGLPYPLVREGGRFDEEQMRGYPFGALFGMVVAFPVLAQTPQPPPTLPPPSQKTPAMDACLNPKTPPDKRISSCTVAIESRRLSDHDAAMAYNNRGMAAHYKGQYDRAILDHTESIRLRPSYAEAYSDRGNARLAKGHYAQAVQDYSEAIKLRPNWPSYYNNRCFAYAVLGQTDEALADCDNAIKLAPKRTATLFDSRGYAFARAKRYDAAIRDFSTALEIDPKHASSLWGRGYAYLRKGEAEKAQRDFATARVIDPAIEYKMADIGLTVE